MKNFNKQINQAQKLLYESSDAFELKEAIRQMLSIIDNFEQQKEQIIQDKDKQFYHKLNKYKDLEEKFMSVESQLRRLNINYNNLEQECQKQKKQNFTERRKSKELVKIIDKITNFMHGSYNYYKNEALQLQEQFQKTLLNLGTHKKMNFKKIFSKKTNEVSFDQEILNQNNFSIGTKKRLENMIQDQKKIQFDYKDCQVLYDRLYLDLQEVKKWHNISVDMMLDRENNEFDGSQSPPPEEIKLGMPDLSALEIKKSVLYQNMNDSMHFNLDDLLKKENFDFKQQENPSQETRTKTFKTLDQILSKLLENVKNQSKIQEKDALIYLDQMKEFYYEVEKKIDGKWNNQKAKDLSTQFQQEIIDLEKQILQKKTQNQINQQTEEQLKKENTKLEEQLKDMKENEKELIQSLEELQINLENQSQEFTKKQSFVRTLKNQIRDKNEENKDLESKYEQMVQQEYQMKLKIEKENILYDDMKKEIDQKQTNIEGFKKKLVEYQDNIERLKREETFLQQLEQKQESEVKNLEEELNQLKPKIQQLNNNRDQVLEEIAKIEIELMEQVNLEQQLLNQKNNIDQQKNYLENVLQEKQQQYSEKKNDQNLSQEKVDELRNQLTQISNNNPQVEILLEKVDKRLIKIEVIILNITKFLNQTNIEQIVSENKKVNKELDEINDEYLRLKEEILRKENENFIMRELKKKVGNEIDKIVQKRNTLERNEQENFSTPRNYVDIIYEEMQNLRKNNSNKNLNEDQQKKVKEIITMIKEEKDKQQKLLDNQIHDQQESSMILNDSIMTGNLLKPEQTRKLSVVNQKNQRRTSIHSTKQQQDYSQQIYGNISMNADYFQRDQWSKMIKDELKILSTYLKNLNVVLNITIHIFQTFLEDNIAFEPVKKFIYDSLNKGYETHSKYIKQIGDYKKLKEGQFEDVVELTGQMRQIFEEEAKIQEHCVKQLKLVMIKNQNQYIQFYQIQIFIHKKNYNVESQQQYYKKQYNKRLEIIAFNTLKKINKQKNQILKNLKIQE